MCSQAGLTIFTLCAVLVCHETRGSPPATASSSSQSGKLRHDIHGAALPPRAVARLGSIRLRHSDPVEIVAFSPDGKWLASYCIWERSVSVWSTADGKLRCRVPVQNVARMAFTTDGNTLAVIVARTFTAEILVECWDLRTMQRIVRFRDLEHYSEESVLAFAPDGKHLYFGRSSLRCLDVAAGKLVYQQPVGQAQQRSEAETISSLVVTADASTLVTAEGDKTIRFREPPSGRERCRFDGIGATRLAFAATAGTLALATSTAIEIWQMRPVSGQVPGVKVQKRRLPRSDPDPVIALALAPDGKRLLTLTESGVAGIWDAGAGEQIVQRRLPLKQTGAAAFGPAGPLVFAASDSSRRLRIWNIATGKELFAEEDLGNKLTCLGFSPDGKTLVTGGDDKVLRFWESGTGKPVAAVRLPDVPCQADFSRDGKNLVAGGNGKWWSMPLARLDPDADSGIQRASFVEKPPARSPWDKLKPHRGRKLPWKIDLVDECTLTPDGYLIDMDRSGVRLLEAGSRKKLCEVGGNCTAAALIPNRRVIAVLRNETGRQSDVVITLNDVNALADQKLDGPGAPPPLPSPGGGQELDRFEIPRRETIPGQSWLVPRIAFAPGGRLLAAGTPHGAILFWDIAVSQQIARLEGHDSPIVLLAFAPDGKRLACAYRDATVLVWDITNVAPRSLPPNAAAIEKYWQELEAPEAGTAWKAHWGLVASAPGSMTLLKQQLHPVPRVAVKPLPQRIKDLDSPRFAVRQRAMKDIESMGQAAETGLREALKKPGSLETSRRLQQLLDKIAAAHRRELLELRAIAVLEQIGSADARQLVETLAGGAPQAPLTLAAQAARKRWMRLP